MSSDPDVKDTVQLTVRVPDLVDFSQINTHIGTLAGAVPGKHTDNHWCTQKMLDSLVAAVIRFYSWTTDRVGGGAPIVLGINDMSLKSGGVFDIDADWNLHKRHSFHRVGLSVDINRSGMQGYQMEQLTRIMSRYGAMRNDERPQIHYGFDRGN